MQKITIDDLVSFDDIEKCIVDFCDRFNIPDMSKEIQNRFDACMMYLYNNLFNKRKYTYYDNTKKCYILPVIDLYADLYIYVCGVYGKIPTVLYFCYMLGIQHTVLYKWIERDISFYRIDINNIDKTDILKSVYNNYTGGVDNNNIYNIDGSSVHETEEREPAGVGGGCVRCKADYIRQKIMNANEGSLAGLLTSGKGQAVGIIAILNHVHRWSDNGAQPIQENKPELIARKNVFSLPKND